MNATIVRRWIPIVGVLAIGVALYSLLPLSLGSSGKAQTTTIPPETAVRQALLDAQAGGPGTGALVGEPTQIRGAVMTYAEAEQFVSGRVPSTTERRHNDRV